MQKGLSDVIREKKPMIHMITNYVTVKDVVNIMLAAGGTAICADAPEEAAEITAAADGLLINIGTPSAKGCTAMLLAGKEANRRGIPVVLDPVGAGASSFRDGILSQLLEQIHFTCIRGNATEVAALCHMGSNHSGVEAADDFLPPECIQQLAVKTGAIIVVTGETDIITDGKKILTEKRGTDLLKKITGAGCMLSGLICCSLAAIYMVQGEKTETVAQCIHFYNDAAEEAKQKMLVTGSTGTGTFGMYLMDEISR